MYSRLRGGTLEAFAVHDGWARLIVLLLANPHLLEGGQGGQDGAPDPHRVLTLRGSNNLQKENKDLQGILKFQATEPTTSWVDSQKIY